MAYLHLVSMPFLFNVVFDLSSGMWLLACIAVGLAYATLLYNKKSELSQTQVRMLFALRTLAVAGIAYLLFAPLIRITTKTREKPIILIAQDNSASVNTAKAPNFNLNDYAKALKEVQRQLSTDFEVRYFQFGEGVKEEQTLTFQDKVTNISSFFRRISDQFQNRNIGAIILSSDGIYNQGGNPQFEANGIKAPIYTIALGDTTPKKDILISNVRYNDIVYLNNQFQIEVDLEGYLSNGSTSNLTISNQAGVKAARPINVSSNNFQVSVPLVLNADKKGIQQYEVKLSSIPGELSLKNNQQTIFIEVIDGRREVVIVANSPHPDLTALKQGIEENRNFAVKIMMAAEVKSSDIASADLLVLHQLPSGNNQAEQILKEGKEKPVFFILGSQTNISAFSNSQNLIAITATNSIQETFGAVNPGFYAFSLSEPTRGKLQQFAPLLVPYGNYEMKAPSSVLLSQKIGSLNTNRPLLVFSKDQERRIGILTGEGVWRWRLNDFEENGDHSAFNEFISKTVQYLSTTEDKRRFRVFTSKKSYEDNEQVVFNAELYNNSYELINTPEVNLVLKNKQGKTYSFLFSRINDTYELNAGMIPAGEYSFTSTTALGDEKYSVSGQFVIVQQQAEFVQTTANHQLLYTMSKESGGEMVYPDQLEQLLKLIKQNELVKVVIHEEKRYEELIDVKWVFFILLLLLTLEWFTRKRAGEI